MNYNKLINQLNNLEAIAYGYNINGEVLGMDCSDFEQIMIDCADAISQLLSVNNKLQKEKNNAVNVLETIMGSQKYCALCKNLDCKNSNSYDKSCKPIWNGDVF